MGCKIRVGRWEQMCCRMDARGPKRLSCAWQFWVMHVKHGLLNGGWTIT